jgi:monofunctional biosynthetic peptidoglycan transglycosylase
VDLISLEQISPVLVCAVVKAEDRNFFRHRGFDWQAIRAAARGTLKGQPLRGGSTITQQLARNLYLSPKRSLHRKLREALIARRLEHTLTKPRILELYLNSIEWGEDVWGIGAASRHYVGKAPADLDAAEASFLASLVAAPRSPLEGENGVRAHRVQRRVLNQLFRAGLLSPTELQRARAALDAISAYPDADTEERSPPSPFAEPGRARPLGGSVVEIIRSECGLERELDAERMLRKAMRREP